MNFRQAISMQILAYCHDKNMSLNELCKVADVPISTLKNILNGESQNPGVLTLRAILNGLGVDIVEFFQDVEALMQREIEV